jgi:uncharacterized coiled-coil DUF342 family protein
MNNTAVWIVVAVVAVIVLAGLVFAARSRRNQRRHVEAEQMREELTTHVEKADKRQTIADETAAKARAAQAEAEAKAAEAARLQQQAAGHHEAVAASREEIEERRRHADMLDPKTRVDDDADDQHVVEQDRRVDQNRVVDHNRVDQAAAQQEGARHDSRRG